MIPELVLALDLFLAHLLATGSAHCSLYSRSVTDYKSRYLDGAAPTRNIAVTEMLKSDPEAKKLLIPRTDRVQLFLGPQLRLLFEDLLCIICGGANMKIKLPSSPTGSVFDKVFIQQEALRTNGSKFFELHCILSTVFSDIQHLSASSRELDESLALFDSKHALIVEFMKLNSLYDCVIPFRGVHNAGYVPPAASSPIKKRLRENTCVGSFYTMFGILKTRYDTETILRELWQPKILHSNSGILKIATESLKNGREKDLKEKM